MPSTLTLNFADYPYLIGKINEAARNEMRTPEMQAMWIIKMYLDANSMRVCGVEEEKAS